MTGEGDCTERCDLQGADADEFGKLGVRCLKMEMTSLSREC